MGSVGVQRFGFEKFVNAKIDNSKTLETFSLIWRLLLLAALVGCAASQAAHEIQEGRRALLTGSPEIAVQYFERAAALDSKNAGSPLGESAWTYVGRAYYEAGKYSLARQAFDRALAQNQDDDIARLYLGLIGAHEKQDQSSHKQIQAGLQGVYDRIDYIKRFTFVGEFWDPSNQLTAELQELIKAVSAAQVSWSNVIPRVERLVLKIENEVDQAQRDEVTRYRGGSDGGDM
ncbi:MAG TPA: tetratricopeptide repeat protein [Candidatus Binatia bacterium]|nr:tetratricopeptide repeat protein [Candidatus Binatia bacterium]